jgi:PPOX class probable F420-dependent enzyme
MYVKLPKSVREFLKKPNFAVLATISPSGKPQATPVWFLVDEDHILVNTSKGRVKLRNVEANPHVALEVHDLANPYQFVQIRGEVKLDPANGARDIDRLSQRYRGKPYAYPPTDAPAKRVSIRIRPTGFTSMGLN